MEELFELLFGTKGRINRAQYWRSLVISSVAGLFTAVILFAAAAIAAPIFIVMVILVFIPWLMWGFAIHTERLHDRDKSAWWRLVFYVVPVVLGQFCESSMVCGRNRHVAALRPGIGKFCAHNVGMCRNRLAAQYRGA